MNEYSERFGTDFLTNKQSLNEISVVRSKGLKNKIAGYITKILQRQAKFEERKQMIIDNEKKSQERRESRFSRCLVGPCVPLVVGGLISCSLRCKIVAGRRAPHVVDDFVLT